MKKALHKKENKRKRPKGNAFKNKKGYCECGRPTVLTKEVIQKLEDVFSISGTDEEACLYAGIGMSTLYNYQKENPVFQERKLIKYYNNKFLRRGGEEMPGL